MIKDVKVIVFDADDTLWDNQSYFDGAERVFVEELREYGTAEELSETLFATESANMPVLGYGAKAVCISMMETALAVSHGKIPGENLSRILSAAKSLLSLPAEPLPGVGKTLKALKDSGRYRTSSHQRRHARPTEQTPALRPPTLFRQGRSGLQQKCKGIS